MLLAVLILWAGTTLADDPMNIGKFKFNIHPGPINLYQGGPMDSVLVIKGKIDMSQTDYYSMMPVIGEGSLMIDGKPIEIVMRKIGVNNKIDFVPQRVRPQPAGPFIFTRRPERIRISGRSLRP